MTRIDSQSELEAALASTTGIIEIETDKQLEIRVAREVWIAKGCGIIVACVEGSCAVACVEGSCAVAWAKGSRAVAWAKGSRAEARAKGSRAVARAKGSRAEAWAKGSRAEAWANGSCAEARAKGCAIIQIGKPWIGPLPKNTPKIKNIDAQILKAITAKGCKLEMDAWHKCRTTHCRAGWAIALAGKEGAALETYFGGPNEGSFAAGAAIYAASRPGVPIPDFFATDEDAMRDIVACAAMDALSLLPKKRKPEDLIQYLDGLPGGSGCDGDEA